ncbi:unnamed protein product [Anisakis simplex]|uniref:Phosducin domain-containing protein n=1 Tax=Anisakis simplex TaxID=6269 RepID=A0A0M3JAR4_ANISI|nr:unnamed protein product [Anisakis simplex]
MYRLMFSCYTTIFESVSFRRHFFRRRKCSSNNTDEKRLTLSQETVTDAQTEMDNMAATTIDAEEDDYSLSDEERLWQQLRERLNSADERNANPPTIIVQNTDLQSELESERPEVIVNEYACFTVSLSKSPLHRINFTSLIVTLTITCFSTRIF